VAIFGASSNPLKIGGRPINNMRIAGYQGRVLPINPMSPEIQGHKSYPSLDEVEGPVDMAIIVVPQEKGLVEPAVRACINKGVKAAIILSSGFAEIDDPGAEAQARIAAAAEEAGLRVMGPNCMGTMNANTGMIATFTSGLVDKGPEAGGISIASQSGAFGAHCYMLAKERGLGLNLWATMGNQCDVEFSDCLAYMAEDPKTEVVMGYIEGIQNPERFQAALAHAQAQKKPVVLMKVGRSDVGAAAAASHTASLAGSDAVFDALLKQYDVYRASSIDEMFDVAYAASFGKFPETPDLGVITVSGGVGVIMADAAEDAGMALPELPQDTQDRMRDLVPFAGTRNPLDVTAQFINDPSLMNPMYEALLGDGGYQSSICFGTSVGLNEVMMEKILPQLQIVGEKFKDRALALSFLTRPDMAAKLEDCGFMVFEDPARGINALAALHHFGKAFAGAGAKDAPPAAPGDAPPVSKGAALNETQSKAMLAAYGLPMVDERTVASSAAAAEAANAIGYPVVMKIVSADILHKSEIGGVILNVQDGDAASEAYETLMDRAKQHAPAAHVDGIMVAPMIDDGVETIMGVVRDPVFGPTVMFGLGGVFVEVLKDVTFRVAPFGVDVANEMINEVKGRAMLDGVRGAPPSDIDALADALAKLSVFAAANADTLETADVNPFLVRPKGKGAVAVDALVIGRTD
jgi:acyl-CoA synthetase (NDP forming)